MYISFKSIKININQTQIGTANQVLLNTPNNPHSAETPIHEQVGNLQIHTPTNPHNLLTPVSHHESDEKSDDFPPPPSPSPPPPQKTIPTSYSVETILSKQGYMPLKRFTKSLQGSIWQVLSDKAQETQVVKVTNKALHKQSIAYIQGKSIKISENIVKETAILRYLSSQKPPLSLTMFKDCFCDKYNYFLVMEDAGEPMFNFVKESHQLIKSKLITISEWHRFCKNAMHQMVTVLEWMHNAMHCCHLDVSLENFSIKNLKSTFVTFGVEKRIKFCSSFKIKIIDFGLAEVFTNKHNDGSTDFRCNKYVGKTTYKAPKVFGKKHVFDARSADVWSLAVCFFMMFIGSGPWKKPINTDVLFKYIYTNGRLIEVLDSWDILHYCSAEILDLLLGLFRSEQQRLTMKQISEHCWFNTY